jgi:PKD repeat protein
MRTTSLCCALAALAALALPGIALAQPDGPDASFSYAPENPRTGDSVRFVSSSCQPGGQLASQSWDLDGDGQYDDATGPEATTVFSGSGAFGIGLQVVGAGGRTDTSRRMVMVDTVYALPREDSQRLMSPFPVVTVDGRLTKRGARITVLTVRGPVCASVSVSCRGRGCPARKKHSAYIGHRRLRLRRFERAYRAGAVMTIRVAKGSSIGKFTQFRIRRHAAPARKDQCLRPGSSRGSRCPRS